MQRISLLPFSALLSFAIQFMRGVSIIVFSHIFLCLFNLHLQYIPCTWPSLCLRLSCTFPACFGMLVQHWHHKRSSHSLGSWAATMTRRDKGRTIASQAQSSILPSGYRSKPFWGYYLGILLSFCYTESASIHLGYYKANSLLPSCMNSLMCIVCPFVELTLHPD